MTEHGCHPTLPAQQVHATCTITPMPPVRATSVSTAQPPAMPWCSVRCLAPQSHPSIRTARLSQAPCPIFSLLPAHLTIHAWRKVVWKHRQVMVSLGPCVEPFYPGWLLQLLPMWRSCQVQACVCFPFVSFQHLANPPSSTLTAAAQASRKQNSEPTLCVISRLDLGQLEISWSRRWGNAVPVYAELQLSLSWQGGWVMPARGYNAQSQHHHLWMPIHPLHSTQTHPRGEVSRKRTKAAPTPHSADLEPGPQQGIGLSRLCCSC